MDLSSSTLLPRTNVPVDHLEKKNRKIAKKSRQQDRKNVLAKELNEKDTSENSETEKCSALQKPSTEAFQDSDKEKVKETKNKKMFEEDSVNDDAKNEIVEKV